MVLAAGLGKRMRPITDTKPKPLVKVFGKTLLDYGLDALEQANVASAVVNVHYLADQIETHLAKRTSPAIEISDERETLLDSGGGVKKALNRLGDQPFFLLNADSFWLEGTHPNLDHLSNAFDESKMDILLLLSSMTNAIGYHGSGDFEMETEGRLKRRSEKKIAPFAYAGAAIFHPRVFKDAPDAAFSLNLLFDRAIEAGTLYGVRMEGLWLHVGTPEAIQEAEQAIAKSAA
ncbi:MAG: nucleotidyltransferase family protein [Salaquimonas sp.]